jgi:hypothetical protein
MNDRLMQLELKRKLLFKKLRKLGNFRRGTIAVRYRKCGKKIALAQNQDTKVTAHTTNGPQQ